MDVVVIRASRLATHLCFHVFGRCSRVAATGQPVKVQLNGLATVSLKYLMNSSCRSFSSVVERKFPPTQNATLQDAENRFDLVQP